MQQTMRGRNEATRNFLRLMQRIRVPLGFLVIPTMFILAHPSYGSMLVGVVISSAGLAMRAWASGYLRKNEKLATSGPYSYTRNPLYLGTLALGAGAAICTGNIWLVVLFAALYSVVYLPVMAAEVDTMRTKFPAEYGDYSRHVPLLLPRFWAAYRPTQNPANSAEPGAAGHFDVALYLRNREYRAGIGFVVVTGLLVLKMALLK